MANNLFAFIGMHFTDQKSMINESLTEFYGGSVNFVLITMGAIIISVLCIYLLRNEFEKIEIKIWRHTIKKNVQLVDGSNIEVDNN